MTLLEAIVLGIAQGLTEFLPVSSSGHLVLLQKLFGITDHVLAVSVMMHFGTLFSVVVFYRRKILEMLKKPFSRFNILVVLTAVPAALVGILFSDFFDSVYSSGRLLGFSFLLTALILWLSGRSTGSGRKEEALGVADSLTVGLAQCLAILPGVSRSGTTISAGLFRGIDRELAAMFSFLNSIILIAGATALELPDMFSGGIGIPAHILLAGFLVSFATGYAAIAFMVNLLKTRSLRPFSWYVGALGILVLADQFIFRIFL